MTSMFTILVSLAASLSGSRADLALENLALREQLAVYQRQVPRPRLRRSDRMFWIWLSRHWARWRSALVIVHPDTVLKWHRAGYRAYWGWVSKKRSGRPTIPRHHISFIRRISADHPEWGEDRIALELRLKIGVEHSPSTVRRYMVEDVPPRRRSTWRSFLKGHASQIWAMDLVTQVLWNFEMRFILVVMALDTRRIVHVAVTGSPSLDWVRRQLMEATPWGIVPRFLLHDNDGIFGQYRVRPGFRSALDEWLSRVLGARGLPIPYGAPNANAFLERFAGTLRRECLDHFLFVSEDHLRRVVGEFVLYDNQARPHQGIQAIPAPSPSEVSPVPDGTRVHLVARPVLGGLHHDYRLAA